MTLTKKEREDLVNMGYTTARSRRFTSEELRVARSCPRAILGQLATNPHLDEDMQVYLADSKHIEIREYIAANPGLTSDAKTYLAKTKSISVALALLRQEELPSLALKALKRTWLSAPSLDRIAREEILPLYAQHIRDEEAQSWILTQSIDAGVGLARNPKLVESLRPRILGSPRWKVREAFAARSDLTSKEADVLILDEDHDVATTTMLNGSALGSLTWPLGMLQYLTEHAPERVAPMLVEAGVDLETWASLVDGWTGSPADLAEACLLTKR